MSQGDTSICNTKKKKKKTKQNKTKNKKLELGSPIKPGKNEYKILFSDAPKTKKMQIYKEHWRKMKTEFIRLGQERQIWEDKTTSET